jgi:hypothetical protein
VDPRRSMAFPSRMTESRPSVMMDRAVERREGIPCRIPPISYASPGMTEDAGLRHHYIVSLLLAPRQIGENRRERGLTLRVKELRTTETLEKAMAKAAIIGCR